MYNEHRQSLEHLLRQSGQSNEKPFSDLEIFRFLQYYELVLKWNSRLHLTTLIDPPSFYKRHILESKLAASLLGLKVSEVWDLGSGLGIPGIPTKILRPDLKVKLIEAKPRKAIFLEEVIGTLRLENAVVVNDKIENLPKVVSTTCLMARAVEKMSDLVSLILDLGVSGAQIILLGSETLLDRIQKEMMDGYQLEIHALPVSEKRKAFVLYRST